MEGGHEAFEVEVRTDAGIVDVVVRVSDGAILETEVDNGEEDDEMGEDDDDDDDDEEDEDEDGEDEVEEDGIR
jgi:hypothetical protein